MEVRCRIQLTIECDQLSVESHGDASLSGKLNEKGEPLFDLKRFTDAAAVAMFLAGGHLERDERQTAHQDLSRQPGT